MPHARQPKRPQRTSTPRAAPQAAVPQQRAARPEGLAFDIPDLMMMRGWADYHNLPLTLSLDTVIDGAEYEEYVIIGDGQRCWHLWRLADGIAVRSAGSKAVLFAEMPDALDLLIPAAD